MNNYHIRIGGVQRIFLILNVAVLSVCCKYEVIHTVPLPPEHM